MMDIKNIPGKLKTTCSFCVWKFEKRNGQKTKMPFNPATGERARINDLRTFSDFKNTLVTYAMGGYDGIGIAVGNGIGAFDIDHCIREDGTLNDTADTVLSIFPTAYVEKSPSGKGLRGFFCVPEDYVYDKTVYYINNRSKGLEVYMPGATNRFVTVTGDVYRTGEIPNDETAMTTLLDTLMKRNKQVQQTHFQHHSYLDDEAVIAHANEASNSEKFKKLFAGDWEDLYGSQSDADMALLSILAFWCGCDEEQMDRIFRTSGLMRDKWDRKQAGSTYGAISIRNTVNTCSAVYMPVNAQDIVDEEFSKLDEDDYVEFQPDLTKITITLEEMAPHTNARYGRNEIGMGNMFADYFKQIARYNSERKGWYVYDGSVWRPDKGNLKVSELAKLLADKLYVFALTITEEDARKRFIDRVRKLQLRKNRETMLRDAMSVYPISMQAFDRNKYFFNCKNGTLDMRTLEFREHRPEDYLTMESGITYDPEADCPRWHSFIKEVMCGDADLADFLQRSLGYALTGDTSQECMFMSIAGKRDGLDGSRSSLFYEAIRIVKEMRCKTNGEKPRFIVWENVPGAFSSNKGQDFKAVLEAVISVKEPSASVPAPEKKGWPDADYYVGDGWSVAYRVFDAQWWGVPQRRKRIYLVADFADQSAPEILFNSEGLSRYSAEGFRAWQRAAAGAEGCTGEAGCNGAGGRICLNDQGGTQMDVSEDVTGTLRAQEHGHLPKNSSWVRRWMQKSMRSCR